MQFVSLLVFVVASAFVAAAPSLHLGEDRINNSSSAAAAAAGGSAAAAAAAAGGSAAAAAAAGGAAASGAASSGGSAASSAATGGNRFGGIFAAAAAAASDGGNRDRFWGGRYRGYRGRKGRLFHRDATSTGVVSTGEEDERDIEFPFRGGFWLDSCEVDKDEGLAPSGRQRR